MAPEKRSRKDGAGSRWQALPPQPEFEGDPDYPSVQFASEEQRRRFEVLKGKGERIGDGEDDDGFGGVEIDNDWGLDVVRGTLMIKGPEGDQIHDVHDKISVKFEFVAHKKGPYSFCFNKKSPYHETIDFDVQVGHFTYYEQHAKDEHVKPLIQQIEKLAEALYNIQFEQPLAGGTERPSSYSE